jgi:hypothetical protein
MKKFFVMVWGFITISQFCFTASAVTITAKQHMFLAHDSYGWLASVDFKQWYGLYYNDYYIQYSLTAGRDVITVTNNYCNYSDGPCYVDVYINSTSSENIKCSKLQNNNTPCVFELVPADKTNLIIIRQESFICGQNNCTTIGKGTINLDHYIN